MFLSSSPSPFLNPAKRRVLSQTKQGACRTQCPVFGDWAHKYDPLPKARCAVALFMRGLSRKRAVGTAGALLGLGLQGSQEGFKKRGEGARGRHRRFLPRRDAAGGPHQLGGSGALPCFQGVPSNFGEKRPQPAFSRHPPVFGSPHSIFRSPHALFLAPHTIFTPRGINN